MMWHIRISFVRGVMFSSNSRTISAESSAGTGSEMQQYALISDEDTHQKMACGDPKALARYALLDPTLAVTQPHFVIACSGLDAIAHAVETAVFFHQGHYAGVDVFLFADVDDRVVGETTRLTDFLDDAQQRLFFAAGDDHLRAQRCQLVGNAATDAGATPGDQNHLAFEESGPEYAVETCTFCHRHAYLQRRILPLITRRKV